MKHGALKELEVELGLGVFVSESLSEIGRLLSLSLAFFWDAMFLCKVSPPMLPTHHGAQQGDMVWGKPIRRPGQGYISGRLGMKGLDWTNVFLQKVLPSLDNLREVTNDSQTPKNFHPIDP